MKINCIITGATGMVGKGVLLECLDSDHVESVLVIGRRSLEMQHPKLKELVHKDFLNLDAVADQLTGYNACFFCMGVSAAGMKEADYHRLTYELVEHFVETLHPRNPEMVFNYVSGQGTDSSAQGRTMWARIKGKTENMVLAKGFKDAYAFRPGAIIPRRDVTSSTRLYRILITLFKPFFGLMAHSKNVTDTQRIGWAMMQAVLKGHDVKVLEPPTLNGLADDYLAGT